MFLLTQRAHRAGLHGRLALVRSRPRYVGRHPGTAEVLGRQRWRLGGRRRGLDRRGASSRLLVGVGDLVGVGRRAAGRHQDGRAHGGGGPVALAGRGGEEGPRRGVVGRSARGGGAAGGRGSTATSSSSSNTSAASGSVRRHHGRWAIVWKRKSERDCFTVFEIGKQW